MMTSYLFEGILEADWDEIDGILFSFFNRLWPVGIKIDFRDAIAD